MALYSDLNMFGADKTPLVADYLAVMQSIYNIMSTRKGTRIFNPEFGSLLEDFLFEPCCEDTAFKIFNNIVSEITEQDQRVIFDLSLTSVTPYPEEHKYNIVIANKIAGLGDKVFTTPFTLQR